MAQTFYEIEEGLELNGSVFLAEAGVPGTGGSSDAVLKGSYYLDTSGGVLYIKDSNGTGTDKWKAMATQEYVNSYVASTVSWREPADAHDDLSTSTPLSTTNIVDGETVFDGMRILFSNFASDKNIWIATGITGNWTWTEDINNESVNDTLYVLGGTHEGKQYVYNGTDWVLANLAELTEDGFLRAFIGKSGIGNELPDYATEHYITDGDNLEVAIGKLDGQTFANKNSITAIELEASYIQSFIGKAPGNELPAYVNENYIADNDNLETAISKLDGQVFTNRTDINTNTVQLAEARTETIADNVTTVTMVDSVLVDNVAAVKWIVYCQGTAVGDAPNKRVVEVLATHDGHNVSGGLDATDIDRAIGPKIKFGTITGLNINVALTGSGIDQKIELQITSTMAVDVKAIREIIVF